MDKSLHSLLLKVSFFEIIYKTPIANSFFAVLLQFDKSINAALSNKVKSRITFKASKLNTYRFCDNVWTLM